ncbi:DUF6069 family protein [Nocardiopsis nanhaiensis]
MTESRIGTSTARSTPASWRPRLAAVAAATAANIVLALLAPLFGADLEVAPPGQDRMPLSFVDFALFSAAFGLIGWGALAVAERLFSAGRGRLVWTAAAVLFTVVSFVPSLNAGATPATAAVLVFSHVVVAAIVIPVFWRSSRAA